MSSYQDMDVRLAVVEDKLAFIMKISQARVAVGHPLDPRGATEIMVSFDKLYAEVKRAGGDIIDVVGEKVVKAVGDGSPAADPGNSDAPAVLDGVTVPEAQAPDATVPDATGDSSPAL